MDSTYFLPGIRENLVYFLLETLGLGLIFVLDFGRVLDLTSGELPIVIEPQLHGYNSLHRVLFRMNTSEEEVFIHTLTILSIESLKLSNGTALAAVASSDASVSLAVDSSSSGGRRAIFGSSPGGTSS